MNNHRHSPTTLIVACLAAILCAMLASACSTTRGFGRDLQHLGNEIEQEANEHL